MPGQPGSFLEALQGPFGVLFASRQADNRSDKRPADTGAAGAGFFVQAELVVVAKARAVLIILTRGLRYLASRRVNHIAFHLVDEHIVANFVALHGR